MKIVFAEGFGLKKNPYFNHLPLNGTKGELLTIKAPELKLNVVVKSGVFIIPLGAQMFRVGATYEWTDKSNKPTEEARRELSRKLDKILECDYDVMEQVAGIRPTVIDRRPLVGRHQEHSGLFVLNGLGTRGVMLAPYAAEQLYDFIEKEIPLDEQLSIDRFT